LYGKKQTQECLTRECENSVFTRDELDRELERYSLTTGFMETAHYCRDKEIPLVVLSDGLDDYIEYILGKYGLSFVDYRANHLVFSDGSLGVEFPFYEKGCGKCGNCKRWHIETLSGDGDRVIYVGDGYSDRYAVRSADVVFARRDLAEYCENEKLAYLPFDTFYEVLKYLRNDDGNM